MRFPEWVTASAPFQERIMHYRERGGHAVTPERFQEIVAFMVVAGR